jgi:cytochrome b involved in lipid metabolism
MAGVAGKDATKKFDKYHRRGILERYKKDLQIGTVSPDAQPTGKKGLLGKLGVRKR